MSASGRAAAEKVKQKAHRARTALREAGEELARAPAVSTLHPVTVSHLLEQTHSMEAILCTSQGAVLPCPISVLLSPCHQPQIVQHLQYQGVRDLRGRL